MRPIATDTVCWSICLSVMTVSAAMSTAKTAELIEMPFLIWTWVDPRNHVLDRGPDPLTWRGNFKDEKELAP